MTFNPTKKFLALPKRWKIILVITVLLLFTIPLLSMAIFHQKSKNYKRAAGNLLIKGDYNEALESYYLAASFWPQNIKDR